MPALLKEDLNKHVEERERKDSRERELEKELELPTQKLFGRKL